MTYRKRPSNAAELDSQLEELVAETKNILIAAGRLDLPEPKRTLMHVHRVHRTMAHLMAVISKRARMNEEVTPNTGVILEDLEISISDDPHLLIEGRVTRGAAKLLKHLGRTIKNITLAAVTADTVEGRAFTKALRRTSTKGEEETDPKIITKALLKVVGKRRRSESAEDYMERSNKTMRRITRNRELLGWFTWALFMALLLPATAIGTATGLDYLGFEGSPEERRARLKELIRLVRRFFGFDPTAADIAKNTILDLKRSLGR